MASARRRKFKVTTDSNHQLPVAKNLLDRKFTVTAPNRVWVTDIKYIPTWEGWLYLATVQDLLGSIGRANHLRDDRLNGGPWSLFFLPPGSMENGHGRPDSLLSAYPTAHSCGLGETESTGTADDLAVFVDVKTTWIIEGLAHGHQDLSRPEAAAGVLVAGALSALTGWFATTVTRMLIALS